MNIFIVVFSVTSKLSLGNIVFTVHVDNLNWFLVVLFFRAMNMKSGSITQLIVAIQFWRSQIGILLSSLCTLTSLSTLSWLLAVFVEKSVVINLVELNFCKIFVKISLLRWSSISFVFLSIWLILTRLLLVLLS